MFALHVNQQSICLKKISAKQRCFHVRQDERPCVVLVLQTNVHSSGSVRENVRSVGSNKRARVRAAVDVSKRGRINAAPLGDTNRTIVVYKQKPTDFQCDQLLTATQTNTKLRVARQWQG